MYKILPLKKLRKKIVVPPDKSISHRALLISAVAQGKTEILNFLDSDDTLATLNCIRKLGVRVNYRREENRVTVESAGPFFSIEKRVILYTRESGTTLRLLSGILASQKFSSQLSAGKTLRRRPMRRVTHPLRMMGADIRGREMDHQEYPPLKINPVKRLQGITYKMPQASAQVKSAILFASLYSEGITRVKELYPSRDHTERMLKLFGAKINRRTGYIMSKKSKLKSPGSIFIPGDISSASNFLALGTILKDSEILLKDVGINPTRAGFIATLRRMGARIKIINKKSYFEPYADILVRSSCLRGIKIEERQIPLMIDEIPILMVCASFAKGLTQIYGVRELRVKETDRIHSMLYNLKRAGIDIKARSYGKDNNWMVEIRGAGRIKSTCFRSLGDHRTAMSLVILALASDKVCTLDDTTCINKSFPEFISIVNSLYD
jgi:3-phosphoshikimate 1-carboxyvinyltransferase